jgi:hypothetical protein
VILVRYSIFPVSRIEPFALHQFTVAKRRFGSFTSFWAGPADVGFAPESDRNSDLPGGRLVPFTTLLL